METMPAGSRRKRNTCAHDGCVKRPIYNKPGETKGVFCNEHKSEGMVDVKNKKCEHDGCVRQPVFKKPRRSFATSTNERVRSTLFQKDARTMAA